MSSMFAAFVFVAALSVAAWFGLHEYGGFSAADRQSASDSVRLDSVDND